MPQRGRSLATTVNASEVLNGDVIVVTIPQLSPGVIVSVTFQATLNASAPIGGTLVNTATVAAQSMAMITAVPAVTFVGVMDTVFDALAGSAHPIAGAVVSLLDSSSGTPVKLGAVGSVPNIANGDPFVTGPSGLFSFGLAQSAGERSYDLDVTATGYLHRKINVAVHPGAAGFPTTTLSALDGLPLATVGGFGLTEQPVTVRDLAGFFGNVPLFPPQIVTLTLSVDRGVASAGDRVEYTAVFGPGSRPLSDPADLAVRLPAGFAYAHGSARLAGAALEPSIVGGTLVWGFKDIAVPLTLVFAAVVLPSATQGATVATHATLAVHLSGVALDAYAGVDVAIVGGALSGRGLLSGRVFADHARTGHFMPGDLGLAGVRVFLEDGESVQTDADGRFSFPAVRPGMHVLHVDQLTLPPGMHPYHGFAVNDARSVLRLSHGIFDAGLMDDVNFAISERSER
jgi:hypothetical protein